MSDGGFEWVSNGTQTYEGKWGSTSLTHPASQFNKNIGCNFIMDADGQSLTLQCSGQDELCWGYYGDLNGDPEAETNITILAGTLQLEGLQEEISTGVAMEMGDPNGLGQVNITVEDTLILSKILQLQLGSINELGMGISNLLIKVKEGGSFQATQCLYSGCSFRGIIDDGGTMQIHINNDVGLPQCDATTLEIDVLGTFELIVDPHESSSGTDKQTFQGAKKVREARSPKPGLLKKGPNNPPSSMAYLHIDNYVTIASKGSANTFIQAPAIYCSGVSNSVSIQDSASVSIKTDRLNFNQNVDFTLQVNKGSTGKITIVPITEGASPLNVEDDSLSFPQGLFNFITDTRGDNQGGFTIGGIGNAFQAKDFFAKGLVAINGIVQTTGEKFNAVYEGSHTTITLK